MKTILTVFFMTAVVTLCSAETNSVQVSSAEIPNGTNIVLTMENFLKISNFVLSEGDRQTYCQAFNNNPHYRFSDFHLYLNSFSGNFQCELGKCEFTITIQTINTSFTYSYWNVSLREKNLILQQYHSTTKSNILTKEVEEFFQKALSEIRKYKPKEIPTTQSNNLDKNIVESWGRQKNFFIKTNFEIIDWAKAENILLHEKIRGGTQYHTGWLTIYTKDDRRYLVKQSKMDTLWEFMKTKGIKLQGFGTE